MAKSAFRSALEEAIEQRHSAVHPWSEAWTSGKLDRRLLGEWVKQHYHYVSHFAEWVAAVYANCDYRNILSAVVHCSDLNGNVALSVDGTPDIVR